MTKPHPTPRLNRGQVLRLGRLLHMKYKPAELARELAVTSDTVYRSYIPAGCPCEMDTSGRIWIVGTYFAEWARSFIAQKRNKPRAVMQPGHGYCLRCSRVVAIQNPKRHLQSKSRNVVRVTGRCPECNAKVNRYSKGESK